MTLETFQNHVEQGLKSFPKKISSKYLYDEKGSDLFIEITKLDEYYLTNCEKEILARQNSKILDTIQSDIDEVIEFGCGDGHKTLYLLREAFKRNPKLIFRPIDICQESIDKISNLMKEKIPGLKVEGICDDYINFLQRPKIKNDSSKLFLFLGSNIGNFNTEEAKNFLRSIQENMDKGHHLLIGMDLKKDIDVMNKAYNDSKGVTSEFNFNLLDRINRECDFSVERLKFTHYGSYNVHKGAMESFLVSKTEQEIKLNNEIVKFDKLEPIHIESSYKYSFKDIENLSEKSGFKVIQHFTDTKNYFANSLWVK